MTGGGCECANGSHGPKGLARSACDCRCHRSTSIIVNGRWLAGLRDITHKRSKASRSSPSRPTRRAVYRRDGMCCRYCGVELSERTATLDHVQPWSRGGESHRENLVTCCGPCNTVKGSLTPDEAAMPLREPS